MTDDNSELQPPPIEISVPDDFFDHEGDGESERDRQLLAAPHDDMRSAWRDWHCKEGPGKFVDVKFFGRGVNGVPVPAYDAYKALEQALQATGYQPASSGSYKCRHIDNNPAKPWSLHAYGIAIDIDPKQNPYTSGDPYSGKIKRVHVDAVMQIRNVQGRRVWEWGGSWRTPDRMHFQLDQGPTGVTIDWSTVPGAEPVDLPGITHIVTASSLNLREDPSTGAAVLASLPQGTRAAAQSDPETEADGYVWRKIQAALGGRVVEGWVASQYLQEVGGAQSLDGATHRVAASGLNFRRQPSLTGDLITELPRGTQVAAVDEPEQEHDGYRWRKCRALVGGVVEEGWLAAKYLEAID